MSTVIDEMVSVNLLSNHVAHTVMPTSIYWRGRRYAVTKVGLHHVTHEGRTLVHIFSVTDGSLFFKLQFNTDTLMWRLLETDDGSGYA